MTHPPTLPAPRSPGTAPTGSPALPVAGSVRWAGSPT